MLPLKIFPLKYGDASVWMKECERNDNKPNTSLCVSDKNIEIVKECIEEQKECAMNEMKRKEKNCRVQQ